MCRDLYDWDVDPIREDSLDKLTTMLTIYPRLELGVSSVACDSHPKKTHGFLTGCLLSVLAENSMVSLEELSG